MNIKNAYADHKEAKIKQAMGMYMGLQGAHERAQQVAQASGETDPTKLQQMTTQIFRSDPVVHDTFYGKNGEKNVKAMKDLLNIDLSDPESMNTVQHQALSRVVRATGARNLIGMLGHALQVHKSQSQQSQPGIPGTPGTVGPNMGGQPQQPSQVQAAATSLEQRATPTPTDVKGATSVADSEAKLLTARADLTRAQEQYRDKYDVKLDNNGQWIAYDKSDPTKVIPLKTDDGKPVTGATKVAGEGKVAMIENVPYGITHADPSGKPRVITPGDPEWTPADDKIFQAAKSAAASGEAAKAKLANQRQTFFTSLPQAVMLKQDDPQRNLKAGELAFVTRQEAASKPGMYAPVGSGDKALSAQARFGEIQRTVDGTNQAIADLPDTGFDAKARAQLAYVMRSPNPQSALDEFLKSSAATTLSAPQVEYVQWLASLSESAQALVSLQGMGARSSDRMRAAVASMLPGPGTPSKAYATGQMKKLQTEIDALEKGVPSLGKLSEQGGVTPPGTKPPGTVSFSDAGTIYDIPKDKVSAFKKAHPNATTAK